jgi:hypothetical protein
MKNIFDHIKSESIQFYQACNNSQLATTVEQINAANIVLQQNSILNHASNVLGDAKRNLHDNVIFNICIRLCKLVIDLIHLGRGTYVIAYQTRNNQ